MRIASTLAASVAVALLCGCDSLVTKPSIYGAVDVRVTRRNGDAVAGTNLILYTGQRPMGYATTDSSGAFRFTEVPEGVYGVRALPPSGYASASDPTATVPSDAADQLVVQGQKVVDVRFHFLKKGPGTIVAQVGEFDGTPLAQVPVTLYGSLGAPRTAMTDAAGRFTFDGLPAGTYGVAALRTAAYLDSAETPFLARDGIIIEEGSRETLSLTFVPCSGSISATVRDESGNVVPASTLTLYRLSGDVGEGPVDANGTRVFANLGCVSYGVRVRVPIGWTALPGRGSSFIDGLWVHRGSTLATTLRVQAVACRGTLRIRVEDGLGAAVGGSRLVLYTVEGTYRDVLTASDGQVVMTQIPCDHEYGLRVVPPAGYTVVEGPGSSYFDGLFFTNGLVMDRTFRLARN